MDHLRLLASSVVAAVAVDLDLQELQFQRTLAAAQRLLIREIRRIYQRLQTEEGL